MKPAIALLCAALLAACSSTPRPPYVPPDTAAGKLRTIGFLPVYGVALDPVTQDKLAETWGGYWSDVYPSTVWHPMRKTASMLQGAGLLQQWAEQERSFMQVGALAPATLRAMCAAVGTEGLAQTVIYHAQAGSGASFFLARPLFGGGGEKAGAARVAMAVYACATGEKVWEASQETSYSGNYTQLQFIDYAMYDLTKKIAPR